MSCRGLGAGVDCGLLGAWYDCGLGRDLNGMSRPGAWRLCYIAIFLHVAFFSFLRLLKAF